LSAVSEKSTLRRKLKQRLDAMRMDARKWESAQRSLSGNLKTFLEGLQAQRKTPFILGTFAPLVDEPQWPVAFGSGGEWWSDHGCSLAFPRPTADGGMRFHRAGLGELLVDRGFGVPIMVPDAQAPVVVPDALLVPGLGFGPNGERIGRGKGYYDRYMEFYRGLKIGIGQEEQVVEGIPTDAHDVLMDVVVTSERVLRISKSP
jgi:5-formyltetrahydrofolate cyclo-ligase